MRTRALSCCALTISDSAVDTRNCNRG